MTRANWTALQSLHVLVQCTPDLRRQDCLTCLQEYINNMPLNKVGGRLLWPSCNSRYELYPFYNETAIIAPPPPPQQQAPPPLLPPPASTSPVSSPQRHGKGRNSTVLVVAIAVSIVAAVLLFIAGYCFLAKRTKKTSDTTPGFDGDDITTVESLQLDYKTIQAATNNYSENNKIGRGGFGEVYKGTFSNGKEVAVKILSKHSGQGDTEFKNEVVVVAKLQHRNLVRLIGFSIEGEERILVYEYVTKKSLDYFIFDPANQGQVDWTGRYKIIGDMNPKIADFGMARIFGMDQTQENTSRIVGTYGYMSPEYAMHDQFSMKSDIYSFRVLVLEIISGRKNSSFYETNGSHDLVTYSWRLWNNGSALGLMDPIIVDNFQNSEVVRCIHIGLLCVQKDPVERSTMSTIFMMLTSNTVTLPMPREPGFLVQSIPGKDPLDSDQSTTDKSVPTSVDDSSITDLNPR